MSTQLVNLDLSWLVALRTFFGQENIDDHLRMIMQQIAQQREAGLVIHPAQNDIFKALNTTSLDKVKVVIIGQDPYHGEGQANGLCFSVSNGVALPPSLKNIIRELKSDVDIKAPKHGDLTAWAEQGVLLLNSVLSVEHALPASHEELGWQEFTDQVIELISQQQENVVFMLWGGYAQKKGKHIDRDRHLVLTAPHPSPLSAYRGFLGCQHFTQANEYLTSFGKAPIDWRIV